MVSRRKPWFHARRNTWYVTIEGKQHNLYTSDEQEAHDAWHRLLAERPKADESRPSHGCRSVLEILGLFLADIERTAKPATLAWYTRYIQLFSRSVPADLRADQLKRHHVDEWLATQKWGSPSRRAAIIAVKRAFSWAVEKEYLAVSPIQTLKKPPPRRRETILTPQQVQAIIAESTKEFADLVLVAIETGCRPQEIRVLAAHQFDRGIPGFVLAATEHKTGGRTERSRVIYLTDRAISIVEPLVERHPEGPVFRNRHGKPWTSNAVRCRMRRLRARVPDLPKDLCLTNLRHTYATDALVAGLNPEELRVLLGHQDLEMICRHYSHLAKRKAHMRDAAKRARGEG